MSKQLNYKIGALKRKFKNGKSDFEPGTLISKMNNERSTIKNNNQTISKTKLSIMGLV